MEYAEYRGKNFWSLGSDDDNIDWAYGFFCGCPYCKENYDEPHMKLIGRPAGTINSFDGSYGNVTVLEGSVGQYIGHKDIHGIKIFQGDIIKYPHSNYGYGDPNIPEFLTMEIKDVVSPNRDYCDDMFLHMIDNCEVIGNTFEGVKSDKI